MLSEEIPRGSDIEIEAPSKVNSISFSAADSETSSNRFTLAIAGNPDMLEILTSSPHAKPESSSHGLEKETIVSV
jgi:hypothetical protein